MSAPHSGTDRSHLLNTQLMRRSSRPGFDFIGDNRPLASKPKTFTAKLPGFGPYGSMRRARTDEERRVAYRLRRSRGADGKLPHDIREFYTEGHKAVLSVIGDLFVKYGQCTLTVDKIAQRAGVGERTVQYALCRAKQLGHLAIQYRAIKGKNSLTNVLRVIGQSWLSWLRPRRGKSWQKGCSFVGFSVVPVAGHLSPTREVRHHDLFLSLE